MPRSQGMTKGHRDYYMGLVGVHIWESGFYVPLKALGSPSLSYNQGPPFYLVLPGRELRALKLEQHCSGGMDVRRSFYHVYKMGFEL